MRWSEFADAAPELAAIGRERFTTRNVMILGSLRRDGSPRVSAVGPFFVGDELLFGSMRSAKGLDLLRDSRCELHSAIFDGDGSEGEFKIVGRAIQVTDATMRDADPTAWWISVGAERATVFAMDIVSAAFISWDWSGGTFEITSWSTGSATKRETRPYP